MKNFLLAAAAATIVTLTIIIPTSAASTAESSSPHAASRWKSPNAETPPDQVEQWRAEDAALHAYIEKSVPAVLEHTGSEAFDAHLHGVQAILRHWDAPSHLYNAGLFHSIYGTEGFQGYSMPLSERGVIRNLIGEKAERLCWIFCMVDRSTVDTTVFEWNPDDANIKASPYTFRARPELGRFSIDLTKSEWIDFLELTLADWMEQVEGAAEQPSSLFFWDKGEAYAYRRTAYAKMADILSLERKERLAKKARETHGDVMSTESGATKNLVQLRTPPVSEAARVAVDALRSAGEDIPLNLGPLPTRDEL